MMEKSTLPAVSTIGYNPQRLWGLAIEERVRRIATKMGLPTEPDTTHDGPQLLVNGAFAFDPPWLGHVADHPGMVVTLGGIPAIAHARDSAEADQVAAAMRGGDALPSEAMLHVVAIEDGPTIENKELRKRETPFLMPLRPDTVRMVERKSYYGAYKGVTDILTKYLWPEWALALTRISARLGITPNMITTVGAAFCVAATYYFALGQYWLGMALGLAFMVLDTVDGKLARCTITSSAFGNVFDHGMDLVHPPFWWWFWATGLASWGLAYDNHTFWLVQAAIQGGYLVQRLIEGLFIKNNGLMHIHVWQRFDSRFRLITARRNPNMVILLVSVIAGRPDLGLIAVAWWTVLSCAVHAFRLAQAELLKMRGGTIASWLSEPAR